MLGEPGARRPPRGPDPVRHGERLAEERASHLIERADVDKLEIAVKPERAQQRELWVVVVEAVDLVQRRLDGEAAAAIHGGGAAEIIVAFDEEHSPSGARVERPGRQAAQAGTDDDRVELPCHKSCSFQALEAPEWPSGAKVPGTDRRRAATVINSPGSRRCRNSV